MVRGRGTRAADELCWLDRTMAADEAGTLSRVLQYTDASEERRRSALSPAVCRIPCRRKILDHAVVMWRGVLGCWPEPVDVVVVRGTYEQSNGQGPA